MNNSSIYFNSSSNTTFNLTTIPTTTAVAPYDVFYNVSIDIDVVFRCFTVFFHLVYLIVLIFSKTLQKRTFLFLNHATLVNSFYAISMFGYIWNQHPSFSDQNLNNFLCSISEIAWPFSSYIRAYSILLLAIYRYLATFKLNLFKKINESLLTLVGMIVLVWIISLSLPLIFKYSLSTTNSYTFCLDGSSPYVLNMALYYVFTYIFLIIIPVPTVIVIYVKINRKLSSLAKDTNKTTNATGTVHRKSEGRSIIAATVQAQLTEASLTTDKRTLKSIKPVNNVDYSATATTSDAKNETKSIKKQRNFTIQFIFMCVSLLASSFVLTIFQMRSIITNFFTVFYYWRPYLRIYMNVALCVVPFISLYYHPSKNRVLNMIHGLFNAKVNPNVSTSVNNSV